MSAMKRIRLSYALAALVLLAGCSKKDDPSVIKCFITAASTSAAGTSDKTSFQYGSDNKVSALKTNSYDATFTYDASGNVSKVVQTNQTMTERVEFTYNAKNQVTEANSFPSTGAGQRRTYEYNQTGQLTRMLNVSTGISETYEYPNSTTKNKSRAKNFDSNGATLSTTDFTYDNKKAPYANLGLEPYLSDFSENNVVKETFKSDLFSFTANFLYQYNDRGYPTQVTGTIALVLDPTTTTTIPLTGSYTYDCK